MATNKIIVCHTGLSQVWKMLKSWCWTNMVSIVFFNRYCSTAHQVSVESVPVLWPHVREVAAATRSATPADIILIAGSSIARRGACHRPPWTHFSPEKGILRREKSSSEDKSLCCHFSFGFPEKLLRYEREQGVKKTWKHRQQEVIMLHKVLLKCILSKKCFSIVWD